MLSKKNVTKLARMSAYTIVGLVAVDDESDAASAALSLSCCAPGRIGGRMAATGEALGPTRLAPWALEDRDGGSLAMGLRVVGTRATVVGNTAASRMAAATAQHAYVGEATCAREGA